MANPTYQSGFYAPGRGTALHPELWDGCVGAWDPGLGNTGLSLRDWSGKQKNGTLVNGPTWGVSDGRQALDFDGSNDYVAVTPNYYGGVGFITGRPYGAAMCGWIYKRTTGRQALIGDWDNGGGGDSFVLELNGEKVVSYVRCPNQNTITGNTSVPLNQWIHIAVTFVVGGQAIVYLNGVSDKSQATLGVGPMDNGSSISLARAGAFNGLYVNGQIADIRIYNRALSPNEIRTLAKRPGIAYELAPRKFYSLPAAASSRQYRLFRPAILRGA
jgi:hypothetical protein